jgi:nucleoid DNA-binding protein
MKKEMKKSEKILMNEFSNIVAYELDLNIEHVDAVLSKSIEMMSKLVQRKKIVSLKRLGVFKQVTKKRKRKSGTREEVSLAFLPSSVFNRELQYTQEGDER